jgi:hypothetical protein
MGLQNFLSRSVSTQTAAAQTQPPRIPGPPTLLARQLKAELIELSRAGNQDWASWSDACRSEFARQVIQLAQDNKITIPPGQLPWIRSWAARGKQ